MTNEELIKNIETQIEFEEKSKSEYNLGRKDAYKNILVLFKQLEVPETTEEPTFLKHLTDLFKKHGYDHLGQVALALEHDLELSINKELPVIPQFVADWFEQNKNSLELNIFSLIVDTNESNNQSRTEIQNWSNWEINKPIETLIRMKDGYTIEPEMKYIFKNQRGFVASMIVQQSEAELRSLIKINYTENEKEARKFNKYDKDFFIEVGHLEVEEVN